MSLQKCLFALLIERLNIFFTLFCQGDKQIQVTQLQFRTWPDHGVPRHAMALLNFRDKVRAEVKNVETPILIHCR